MVIKRHKAESSLLPSGAFLHDVNAFNLSILLKMLPNVVLLGVLLDAANKDLLHCQVGAWFIGVLQQKESVSADQTITFPAESASWSGICLPLWTRPSWVQQLARLLYEALLSWHRRLPLRQHTLQIQTLLTACCWGPSSPTNNKMIHHTSENNLTGLYLCL